MAGRDFTFRLIGDSSDAVQAVEKFGSKLKATFDDGKQAAGLFKGAFAGSLIGGALSGVVSNAVGSIGDLVGQAAQASDATDKFKQSLDFAGLKPGKIQELTKSTQEYADKTVYSLGDIQNITAQLASNSVPNYDKLAQAAGNLNAAAGGNAETFKSVGMVLTQTAGQGKLTTENWNQLSDAIPGASGLLQDALLKAGAYTGNFRDAMAKGEISADEFNTALLTLGNKPVAVEAATSTKTLEGAMGNLQATIVGKLAGAFDAIKPFVTGFVNGLSSAVDWIGQNVSWIGPLAAGIGIVAGAIGLWTGVQWLLNAAMAANPIGIVIVAIGLLVGAIIWLAMNWDTVVKWISGVWGGFLSWIGQVINGFVGWWNGVWSAVGQWISNVWSGFVNWIIAVWNGFVGFIMGALNLYISGWVGIWNFAAGFVSGIWNGIVNAVRGAIGWVGSAVQNGMNFISDVWSNIWNGLGGVVRGVWNGVLGWIEGGVNGAIDLINGMIGSVNSIGGVIGIHLGLIPHVGLPRLATGTVTNGPMVALIGDNPGGREVVSPLDTYQDELRRAYTAGHSSAPSAPPGPVRLDDYSIRAFAQIVIDGINRGGTQAVFDSL